MPADSATGPHGGRIETGDKLVEPDLRTAETFLVEDSKPGAVGAGLSGSGSQITPSDRPADDVVWLTREDLEFFAQVIRPE